jgi:hypothetical protein
MGHQPREWNVSVLLLKQTQEHDLAVTTMTLLPGKTTRQLHLIDIGVAGWGANGGRIGERGPQDGTATTIAHNHQNHGDGWWLHQLSPLQP